MWETLASGALLFTDRLHVPLDDPLIDRVHFVLFDSHDEVGFAETLRYYLDRPDEAAAIAKRGRAAALAHHRTDHRAGAILSDWLCVARCRKN
jgi:spore maturation protein CgeB